MADREGFMAPPVLHAVRYQRLAATPTACGVFAPGLEPPFTAVPGGHARTDQTPPAQSEWGGGRAPTFADDFYYRVHILPSLIDVGNLTERVAYPVEVFNAWLVPVTLDSLDGTGTDGLELLGFDPPLGIPALTSADGSLTAGLDGPPAIAAVFTFGFANGDSVALRVTGSRIITFPLSPDWGSRVIERLGYLTDVLESRDGTEQRIMMRERPRWGMEYRILESGEALNVLDSMVAGWGARPFLVPVWWLKAALSLPVHAGEVEARCPTADRGLEPGSMAVLWKDALTCEAVTVASVRDDGVALERPAGKAYPSGYLIPARLCSLASAETASESVTSSLVDATLKFEAEEPDFTPPASCGDVHEGLEVFPWRHDWASPRKRSVMWSVNEYDSGSGLKVRTPRRQAPLDAQEADGIMLSSLAEAAAFKGWLALVGGRARSFWALTEEEQLLPSRGIEAGANLLYVRNTAYGILASASEARRRLFLRTGDGERFIFGVDSWLEAEAGDYLLFLDTPWPRTVALGDISRIGFVSLARLDADEISIERRQDTIARVALTLKGVRN